MGYVLKAVLSSAQHPEYGQIRLPALHIRLAAPGEGEAGGDHPPSQVPPDDGLHRGGREGQQGGSEEVR